MILVLRIVSCWLTFSNRQIGRQRDVQTDGQTDGWTDKRMDGQTDKLILSELHDKTIKKETLAIIGSICQLPILVTQ